MTHLSIPSWCLPAAVVLLTWGTVGLLQKLSTNYLSAESALIWLVAGYVLLLPWLYSSRSIFTYPTRSLVFTLASALLNTLGALALLAAITYSPITICYVRLRPASIGGIHTEEFDSIALERVGV